MGKKFTVWKPLIEQSPQSLADLRMRLFENRTFSPRDQLNYGDYGIEAAAQKIGKAIRTGERIALYADYDVDGTMSCVSWVWFLEALGHKNYVTYIPCRFREGYGVNLGAVQYLIEKENVQLIITMDTGITANDEAAFCRSRGVEFVCTDHHVIQPDKMPDCTILNPKMHHDPEFQELCGCGITFVLLRRMAKDFPVPDSLWTDLLGLAGLATICDIVPLNSVNHRIAKLGIRALMQSKRKVLTVLREACSALESVDEQDVGFRLGPRINAVGRLGHAEAVVRAFIDEDPTELVEQMGKSNDERRRIQATIVESARFEAMRYPNDPILFLGGDWHPGVVGIAASKIAEDFWRPTWLFQRKDDRGKGSARSIPGFDVTAAMTAAGALFDKFGGHRAAGGFTFPLEREAEIRSALIQHAHELKLKSPALWESTVEYDCELPLSLADLDLASLLEDLKPFGHGFEEPVFNIDSRVVSSQYFRDKQTGAPKHTCVIVQDDRGARKKILFFNAVHEELKAGTRARFLATARRERFRGQETLGLFGIDFSLYPTN